MVEELAFAYKIVKKTRAGNFISPMFHGGPGKPLRFKLFKKTRVKRVDRGDSTCSYGINLATKYFVKQNFFAKKGEFMDPDFVVMKVFYDKADATTVYVGGKFRVSWCMPVAIMDSSKVWEEVTQ